MRNNSFEGTIIPAWGSAVFDRHEPSVLMVAAKWWPLSARLGVALRHHGCQVSALCPAGHPLTHVSGLAQVRRYGGIDSLNDFRRALLELGPGVIVPCDDGVVAQLHALHAQEPRLRDLIERSLGPPQSYSIVSNRHALLTTALELGIAVPRTVKVRGVEDLRVWHEEASIGVLKVDGESGGHGVRVCGTLEKSLTAWRELSARSSSATAWKRLAIDRDPLARWTYRTQSTREITMQGFIRGRPANSMLACKSGELLSIVSVVVMAGDGPTGAAIIVQRINNDGLDDIARRLVKRLGLTGFYGLDFMIEAATGRAYLIEMNPRCTQLGHLEFPDQCSLAGCFAAALRAEPAPAPQRPILAEKIAFFPQAVAAHGLSHPPRVDGCYLDVPWDEPGLVKELRQVPWPQRRWVGRLYHAFRPLQCSTPSEFTCLGAIGEGAHLDEVRDQPVPAAEL